jgi:hypothetical protein
MSKSIAPGLVFLLFSLINPGAATLIFDEDDSVPELMHGSLAIFYTYANIIGEVQNDEVVKFEPNHTLVNHGFTGEWVQGLGNGFFARIDVPVIIEYDKADGRSERTTSWGDPIISSKWVFVNSEEGPRAAFWAGTSIPTNGPESLGVPSPAAKLVGGLTAGPGRLIGNLGYTYIPTHDKLDRGDVIGYAVNYEVLAQPNLTFPIEIFGNYVAKDRYNGVVVSDSGSHFVYASGCFAYTFLGAGLFTLCGGVMAPVVKQGFGDDFTYMPHLTLYYNF